MLSPDPALNLKGHQVKLQSSLRPRKPTGDAKSFRNQRVRVRRRLTRRMARQVEAITVRSEVSFEVHRFQAELRRAIAMEAVLCRRVFCQAVSYALFRGGR